MSGKNGVPSAAEAQKIAAEYQNSLAKFKFEQETHRDKTLVLVSGGALTVSFAFVSTLVEHETVSEILWLVAAWGAWSAVLLLTIVGYGLSIRNYNIVIQALSRGDWAAARQVPKLTKVIEPLNNLVSALAVLGFLCFGYFAIVNLERISNEHNEKAHHEISSSEDCGGQGKVSVGQDNKAEGKAQSSQPNSQLPAATASSAAEATKK